MCIAPAARSFSKVERIHSHVDSYPYLNIMIHTYVTFLEEAIPCMSDKHRIPNNRANNPPPHNDIPHRFGSCLYGCGSFPRPLVLVHMLAKRI